MCSFRLIVSALPSCPCRCCASCFRFLVKWCGAAATAASFCDCWFGYIYYSAMPIPTENHLNDSKSLDFGSRGFTAVALFTLTLFCSGSSIWRRRPALTSAKHCLCFRKIFATTDQSVVEQCRIFFECHHVQDTLGERRRRFLHKFRMLQNQLCMAFNDSATADLELR